MRKFIKISILILSVIFLILVGVWLVGRKQAQDAGKTPLTFREFLNLSSKRESGINIGGSGDGLSSDFQGPQTGGNGSSSGGSPQQDSSVGIPESETRVSNFTDNTIIPNTTNTETLPIDANNDGVDDSKSIDDVYDGSKIVATGQTLNECTDRDLNISFTPEEIEKLQALQARFYALSQYLHDDSDVRVEQSNWSTFRTESDRITELYNYCAGNNYNGDGYKIADPLLQYRVPTPFWRDERDPSKDTNSVIPASLTDLTSGALVAGDNYVTRFGLILGLKKDDVVASLNTIFGASEANTRAHELEKILRISLW